MKKIFFLSIPALFPVLLYAQQEPHYTQNQFNSNQLLNPAYAGSGPASSVGLRYRNQWTGLAGAPTTFSFIGDTRIASDRLGIGLTGNVDRIGIDKSFTPDLNIAYHLPVNDQDARFAMGFKAGASFLNSDFSSLSGVTNTDPLYSGSNKSTIPFVGIGVLYYTDKAYAGFSVPRLLSFEKSSARTKIAKSHYYLYGGYRFVFENGLELRPAAMLRYEPQAPLQIDLAADVWYMNMIGFGVSYRTGDAVDYMVKGKIKNLYLGYSYDMTVSGLSNFNNGTHELFFGYEFLSNNTGSYPRRDNIRHF